MTPRKRIHRALGILNDDELEVLAVVAERLAGEGRRQYGPLELVNDTRDFHAEALDEVADAAVYAACALVRERRQTGGTRERRAQRAEQATATPPRYDDVFFEGLREIEANGPGSRRMTELERICAAFQELDAAEREAVAQLVERIADRKRATDAFARPMRKPATEDRTPNHDDLARNIMPSRK